MKKVGTIVTALLISLAVCGCSYAKDNGKSERRESSILASGTVETEAVLHINPETEAVKENYISPEGTVLETRIKTPDGYSRTEVSEGSFEGFLRNYPMKPDKSPVLLYDRMQKGNQNAHEAVFAMHIEPEDFQQCADSVMRIYAEYLYQKDAYDKISFHLVNGFVFDFGTWRKGHKLLVNGNDTSWGNNGANDSSPESFERYLHILFAYASTLSMQKESVQADVSDLRMGDIFIKGGSPGHVVMVVDVCENEAGEKAFLLAQGYMPAQEFHVLKNPLHEENPWYFVSEIDYPLLTPEYRFEQGSFRRPPYLGE